MTKNLRIDSFFWVWAPTRFVPRITHTHAQLRDRQAHDYYVIPAKCRGHLADAGGAPEKKINNNAAHTKTPSKWKIIFKSFLSILLISLFFFFFSLSHLVLTNSPPRHSPPPAPSKNIVHANHVCQDIEWRAPIQFFA